MMGAAVVSCDKSSSTNNNGGDEGEGEVPTESIAIDGNFEDWDACKTAVVATLPADATDKVALKTVKFTSDADYIYCYAEFENHLPALERIDPSWDGNGAWNTGGLAKELTLFIDTDANPKTGMVFRRELGPFNQVGFEVGCELYQYIAVETGKINLGWSQYNYWDPSDERAKVQGEVPEDGYEYKWPPYLWGTDNGGNLDNTLVVRSDFQARLVGTVVKEEFAISRDAMDQLRGQNKVNISVLSYGGDKYDKELYGYLPQGGDKQYITLELMK